MIIQLLPTLHTRREPTKVFIRQRVKEKVLLFFAASFAFLAEEFRISFFARNLHTLERASQFFVVCECDDDVDDKKIRK